MRINKILSIVIAASLAAWSQALPPGVEKKATIAGITEYDYANGLRVLLFPDPSSPKVTVNMTYLVGSRFEGYGETGMAHLLEHMNFIETTNGRSVKKELTDHGRRRQPEVGTRPRSGSHGQHAHRKAVVGYGNDGGPQRIRAWRKQSGEGSGRTRDCDRLPLAQLREGGDRFARRYRKGAHRQAGCVLQEVLSAR